jgi:glutathione S-transferase
MSEPAGRANHRHDASRERELFHIALPDDWEAARADGRYTASTKGRTLDEEGFIHCSFADQVAATMTRFYADVDAVVLLRIDPHRLTSPVVVEDLVGAGEPFPHVYGPIALDAVIDATVVEPASMRSGEA